MHWDDGFEPKVLARMTAAFDQAWEKLKELGHTTDDESDRNALACHVVSLVQLGYTDIAVIARSASELFRREKGTQ